MSEDKMSTKDFIINKLMETKRNGIIGNEKKFRKVLLIKNIYLNQKFVKTQKVDQECGMKKCLMN